MRGQMLNRMAALGISRSERVPVGCSTCGRRAAANLVSCLNYETTLNTTL